MQIDLNILDNLYTDFKSFIETKSKEPLINFKKHSFIDSQENYKYQICKDASETLLTKFWKIDEIGKGQILEKVKSSIQTSVIYNYRKQDNNLIDWRKKDNFSKLDKNVKLEQLFFDLFKSKVPDEKSFSNLITLDFDYQTIAYLFFLKDSNKYMPISQERFDFVFKYLLEIDFKTSGSCSWENYLQYNSYIKQVKQFLSTKHKDINLLDAHSFLWILGWKTKDLFDKGSFTDKVNYLIFSPAKRKEYFEIITEIINQINSFGSYKWGIGFEDNKIRIKIGSVIIATIEKETIWLALDKLMFDNLPNESKEIIKTNLDKKDYPEYTSINSINYYYRDNSKNLWYSQIRDLHFKSIENACNKYQELKTNSQDINNFDFLDLLERELNINIPRPSYSTNYKDLNELANNSSKDIQENNENSPDTFVINNNQTSDINGDEDNEFRYAEELPDELNNRYTEGLKKQITVNSYERNPIARKKCIEYWGLNCSICGFNFQDKYGDLGQGFIHVHHLTKISTVGNEYEINPITDLRPVCPNCHAMLHRNDTDLTIEELQNMIRND